jgi:hypothetical protein
MIGYLTIGFMIGQLVSPISVSIVAYSVPVIAYGCGRYVYTKVSSYTSY